MVNKPLIRPAISWGKRSFGGGGAARIPLNSSIQIRNGSVLFSDVVKQIGRLKTNKSDVPNVMYIFGILPNP